MKNLAFIVNSLGVGGAEKHTVSIANMLKQKGYNIIIFVLKEKMDLVDELNDGINVKFLRINKFYDKLVVENIHKLCNEYKINQLFCVNTYPLLYGYNALKNTNIKCAIIHHTTELGGLKERVKNIYLKTLMNKCNYRIFVSGNQRKYWIDKYNITSYKSYIVRNGIDLEKFKSEENQSSIDQVKRDLNLSSDDLIITCSAMLRPEKNHIQILKSIKVLVDNGCKNLKLLLLGDGSERENIEKFIEENNLSPNVILLGMQKDVKLYYSISDIGIIGSKAVETFSIAALEQMSMGLPMIMSNIGGANEMIIDGFNGYLYELNDDAALVNIVKNIYQNKGALKELKINARTLVEKNFSQEKMIDNYESIINSELA